MEASSGAILVVMNEYLALSGGLQPYSVVNVSTYVWTIPPWKHCHEWQLRSSIGGPEGIGRPISLDSKPEKGATSMQRRNFLKATTLSPLAISAAGYSRLTNALPHRRRNVLFIAVDDLKPLIGAFGATPFTHLI